LLIRRDLYKSNKRNNIRTFRKPDKYKTDIYIQEEKREVLNKYKNKNIVGIDPGKSDLLYCTNGQYKINKKGKKQYIKYRYTQDQYRKESESKKWKKILEKEKKKDNIINHEKILTETKSKSCLYVLTEIYIKIKNEVSSKVSNYYNKMKHRIRKWRKYKKRQKTMAKLVNQFKKIFGNPDETIICMGDWSQTNKLKYSEPTKGKSFRQLFRTNKYKVYLVDEYMTSKKLYRKGCEMEKFRKRGNPRPYKNNIQKVHGLLRSKSGKNKSVQKNIIVNRDLNGSLNIQLKAYCTIFNKKIPQYMDRKNN
jgi:hypothetical protein